MVINTAGSRVSWGLLKLSVAFLLQYEKILKLTSDAKFGEWPSLLSFPELLWVCGIDFCSTFRKLGFSCWGCSFVLTAKRLLQLACVQTWPLAASKLPPCSS